MQHYNDEGFVNIGVGEDISIADLALLIKKIVGYEGNIVWDSTKPDGTPRKLMDVSKLKGLGWQAKTSLEDGIKAVYHQKFIVEQIA
jgi:GDP-L-fucose synthase